MASDAGHHAGPVVEQMAAETIAALMGWPDDRVPDLVRRIERATDPYVHLVFEWNGTVIGPPLDADPNGESFAENVAAELKERRNRWGGRLPR
jgi:hypothetical protein